MLNFIGPAIICFCHIEIKLLHAIAKNLLTNRITQMFRSDCGIEGKSEQ